jgi:hypothetical protein
MIGKCDKLQMFEQQFHNTMYIQRNIEARPFYYCFRGKAISVAYSECVFVALVHQHEMCMRHIITCGLPGSTILFHIISWTIQFSERKILIYPTKNMFFPYIFCMKYFSFQEELWELRSKVHIGLHVMYPLIWSDIYETWFYWHMSECPTWCHNI